MSHEASNWARRCGKSGVLKPGEILVLMLLADHADERWSCFPSQETLAQDSNQSLRTVSTQVKRLRELELITAENQYGKGRGRIGLRYHLHEEAIDRLMAMEPFASRRSEREADKVARWAKRATPDGETMPHANIAGETGTAGALRHADVAGETRATGPMRHADPAGETHSAGAVRHASVAGESRGGAFVRDADVACESDSTGAVRHADPAGELLTRNLAHDSHANQEGSPLREHARINHQSNHQDAGARPGTDDDDDRMNHRGVRLAQLFELVPALTGMASVKHLPVVVDVILDRAFGPVSHPTAYVASALRADLDGVLETAARRWPAPPAPSESTVAAGPASARAAVPCTNPDHAGITDPVDCAQCRLEARLVVPEPVARDLTEAEREALPARLRERLGV